MRVDNARTRTLHQYQIVLRDHNLSDEIKNNFVTPITSVELNNIDVVSYINIFDRICKAYDPNPIVKEQLNLRK